MPKNLETFIYHEDITIINNKNLGTPKNYCFIKNLNLLFISSVVII